MAAGQRTKSRRSRPAVNVHINQKNGGKCHLFPLAELLVPDWLFLSFFFFFGISITADLLVFPQQSLEFTWNGAIKKQPSVSRQKHLEKSRLAQADRKAGETPIITLYNYSGHGSSPF